MIRESGLSDHLPVAGTPVIGEGMCAKVYLLATKILKE